MCLAGQVRVVKNQLHVSLLLVSGLKVHPVVNPVTIVQVNEMIQIALVVCTLVAQVDQMSTIPTETAIAKVHHVINLQTVGTTTSPNLTGHRDKHPVIVETLGHGHQCWM